MRIARLRAPVLIAVAGLIYGCGQKGPLILPDSPKHKKVAPSPRAPAAPAPASGAPAPDAAGGSADATQKP